MAICSVLRNSYNFFLMKMSSGLSVSRENSFLISQKPKEKYKLKYKEHKDLTKLKAQRGFISFFSQ